jgi:hypothetical protein
VAEGEKWVQRAWTLWPMLLGIVSRGGGRRRSVTG